MDSSGKVLKNGIQKKALEDPDLAPNLNPPEPGTVAFRKPTKTAEVKDKGKGKEEKGSEKDQEKDKKRKAEEGGKAVAGAKKAKSNPKLLSFEAEDE